MEPDYLFVDEAGQVSLGNLVAMAGAAANIVLIGDQMQLPQPVQGVHPGDIGLSSLGYLLERQGDGSRGSRHSFERDAQAASGVMHVYFRSDL